MREQTNDSSIPALAHIIRILLFFIPMTLPGPLLFYSVIYWWFVPASMRLDVPLISFPSTGLKIVASLCALPLMLFSRYSSEALASSLPERWTTYLHRIIAPASFLLSILSGLSALCLFTPLIGVPALPPPAVALIFGGLVLSRWLNNLKRGLGVFAHIDAGKRRPRLIVGLSAPQLLATDRRPPILYLRSFVRERSKATTLGRFGYIRNPAGFYILARRPSALDDLSAFLRKMLVQEYRRKFLDSNRSVHDEQMLFAEYFSEFGPYIAIGKPDEAFENMDLGAAKYYVPDEAWTTKVVELINSSGAIVIEAAESEGLSWEIREVLCRVAPEKVLLILPRNEADHREFCIFAAGLFPHPMPEELPSTRLLMFGANWSPIPLEDYTMILEEAVRPFVDRLGLASSRDKKLNQANAADAKCHAAD